MPDTDIEDSNGDIEGERHQEDDGEIKTKIKLFGGKWRFNFVG